MNFKQLKNRLELELFRASKSLKQGLFSTPVPDLTCFVAGHQRSGTNMVMDVLEKHWKTDTYHETDKRAFDDYLMRDIDTIKGLRNKSGGDIFIIKALCELDLLDQLMAEFSPAKIVWIYRHYHDVVNSMVRSFNKTAYHFKLMKNDRKAGGWRSRNISDANYELVQKYVHDDISEATAAALQWVIRNNIYFEEGLDKNSDTLLFNYETLVSNPQESFSKMFEFLSLENQASAYKDVFQSSIGKNKIPEIAPEVEALCQQMYKKLQNAS